MAPSPPSPSSRPLPSNNNDNDNDGAQPRQQPQAQQPQAQQRRAGKRKRIMDPNNHNNNKKNKKKKKEQQLKQYGVDLPDIPGIPVQIIPLHIHTIQTATKFFQRDQQDSIVLPYYESEEQEAATTTTRVENNYESSSRQQSVNHSHNHKNHNHKDVMETVFERLSEAESKQQVTTDEIRKTTERRVRTKDAIQSWLQAIHRWIQDHPPSSSSTTMTTRITTTTNDDKYDPPPPTTDTNHCSSRKTSVPIFVLKHLLELILEHDRMAVRRAATHAMGHLLQKSADCRSWLFHQGGGGTDSTTITTSTAPNRRLLSWMDEVMGLNNDYDDNHHDQPIRSLLLLQQETYRLLQKLEHDGYGELFYPTLPIAVQRFQQFCPQAATNTDTLHMLAVSSSSLLHTNDVERRRTIRDLAMQQYEVEEKRVQKLIHRAHVYMDILVPRFGICDDDDYDSKKDGCNETKVESASNTDTGKQDNSRDDEAEDDDDEDSIDWEDGFDNNNHCSDEENVGELEQNETSHEEAVERTLAVMKSTGGLQNGSLEIDFDRTNNEVTTTVSDNALSLTRQKFEQVVERLAKRHMSRLSVWADCLIAADTLVNVRRQQNGGGGCCTATTAVALMVMTSEQAKRRSDALQCITTLKTQVASILQSAQRLGIDQSKQQQQQQMGPPAVRRTSVIHLSNENPLRKHKRLATTLTRQRCNFKTTTNQSIRHNSSRIQIKYRKT